MLLQPVTAQLTPVNAHSAWPERNKRNAIPSFSEVGLT